MRSEEIPERSENCTNAGFEALEVSLDKKQKTILLICQFFPPHAGGGRSYRASKLAKYWLRRGYKVFVVCSDTEIDSDMTMLSGVDAQNLVVERVSDSWGRGELFRKILRQLTIGDGNLLFIYRLLDRLMKSQLGVIPDVVFTSSAPYEAHFVGAVLKKLWGVRWIADFRDPYTLNANYKKRFFTARMSDRYFEKYIYRQADGVIFNTNLNRDQALAGFSEIEVDKCWVTQNGFDEDEFEFVSCSSPSGDETKIYYIGGFRGEEHEMKFIQEVLAAADELIERNIKFYFCGNGSELFEKQNIDMKGVVVNRPFIESNRLYEYYNDADALLLMLPQMDGELGWVPQKLYSYIRARKSILAVVPKGEVSNYLSCDTMHVVEDPASYSLLPMLDNLRNKIMQRERSGVSETVLEHQFNQKELYEKLDAWMFSR